MKKMTVREFYLGFFKHKGGEEEIEVYNRNVEHIGTWISAPRKKVPQENVVHENVGQGKGGVGEDKGCSTNVEQIDVEQTLNRYGLTEDRKMEIMRRVINGGEVYKCNEKEGGCSYTNRNGHEIYRLDSITGEVGKILYCEHCVVDNKIKDDPTIILTKLT